MATKSVLKNVMIKDPRAAYRLASALENASGKSEKKVTISRTYSEMGRDEIRAVFGDKNDGIQPGKPD